MILDLDDILSIASVQTSGLLSLFMSFLSLTNAYFLYKHCF
jgi:hypothetical protein